MLATKTSTGVPPKVNLNDPPHADDSEGVHFGIETRGIPHRKSNTELPVAAKKGLISSKNRFLVKIREEQLEVNPHAIMTEKPTTMASSPLRNL